MVELAVAEVAEVAEVEVVAAEVEEDRPPS
jgi:hypothetical protein